MYAFLDRPVEAPAGFVLEGEAGIGKSTLWLAGVEHARARGLARALVATGGGRARPRARRAGRSVRGRPRRRAACAVDAEAARARGRAAPRGGVRRSRRSPRARPWRCATCCSCSASESRFWSRSTTSSGSTRPRRARLRSRCEDSLRARVLVLLARRLVDGAQPSELEQALGCGARRAAAGGAAQRRRAPSAPARPVREAVRPPDAAPHPRAVGRQSVLRAGAGARSRRGHRPARAAPGSGDARRARPREARRASRGHARGARARLGTRDAVGVAPGAGGRCGRRARAGSRRARDRARERHDSLHPPAAVVGSLPRPGRASGGAFTRRIAAIVEDPLLRARHLALSSDAPDADVAAVLDDAATLAAERGASAVAAELAEQALRLTPPDARDERHRRALAAARAHRAAGEWTRARTIATDLLAESGHRPAARRGSRPPRRARGPRPGRRAARGGPARGDVAARRCRRVIQCQLAWAARFKKGFVGALEHARAALELADDLDDDALRVERARDPHVPRLRRRRSRGAGARRTGARPRDRRRRRASCCTRRTARSRACSTCAGDVDEARALLEREYEEWHERDELLAATRSAVSRRSSCGAAAGSSRPSTPIARMRDQRPVRARGAVDPSADRGDRRPSRPARDRPRSTRSEPCSSGRSRSGCTRPCISATLGRRRTQEWRPARRPSTWFGKAERRADEARLGRGGQTLVDARPRRGAARARSDRTTRCGSSTRGRRMRDDSNATGCSRT